MAREGRPYRRRNASPAYYLALEPDKRRGRDMIAINKRAKCRECSRVFDLLNELDAQEFYMGHDCESE